LNVPVELPELVGDRGGQLSPDLFQNFGRAGEEGNLARSGDVVGEHHEGQGFVEGQLDRGHEEVAGQAVAAGFRVEEAGDPRSLKGLEVPVDRALAGFTKLGKVAGAESASGLQEGDDFEQPMNPRVDSAHEPHPFAMEQGSMALQRLASTKRCLDAKRRQDLWLLVGERAGVA
jgi:hypothetical protein